MNDKDLIKYNGHLEDHQYRHYNHSLGCFVEGKEHYKYLMRKGGYVPFEMAESIIKEPKHKDYNISKEALDFINQIKLTADSKGKVILGNRAIQRMKELGVNFNIAEQELQQMVQAR